MQTKFATCLLENPAQKKIEEGFFIGLQADICVGWTRNGAGVALGVDFEAHGGHGADVGAQGVGDGDRVKEGGFGRVVRFMARSPLMVEKGQLVSERRAVREDRIEFGQVEMYLGGVEGGHENRNSGVERRGCSTPGQVRWTARRRGRNRDKCCRP